jgi:hypothetical protein
MCPNLSNNFSVEKSIKFQAFSKKCQLTKTSLFSFEKSRFVCQFLFRNRNRKIPYFLRWTNSFIEETSNRKEFKVLKKEPPIFTSMHFVLELCTWLALSLKDYLHFKRLFCSNRNSVKWKVQLWGDHCFKFSRLE